MIPRFKKASVSCLRWLLVSLCSLAITACASSGDQRAVDLATSALAVENTEQILLGRIAALHPHESIDFNSSTLGSGRFQLVDIYTSASGKNCRRIERESDGLQRVVCQERTGEWLATKRLSRAMALSDRGANSLSQGAVSDPAPVDTVIPTGG